MKYILVTYNVCNMGGAQLYVLRRARYLKLKGYEVHIVVCFDNNNFILEREFEGFAIHYVPEFNYPLAYYSKKKCNRIIEALVFKIGKSDNMIIESHTLPLAVWAEKTSVLLKAKHLIYILAEPRIADYRYNPGRNFFEYKLNHDAFYGVSSVSLDLIFGKKTKKHFVNVGFDKGELVTDSYPRFKYRKKANDFVITTVTRLDKTYVIPLIKSVCLLAKKYPNQNFVLIIIGGSKTKGREEFLFSNYNNSTLNTENMEIIYTGYIEKMGEDIFENLDVFVGMGTASINAISRGCLTLNINPIDDTCSGFFGADTNNPAYPENGISYSIVNKLEEAYNLPLSIKQDIIKEGLLLYKRDFEINTCFRKLDENIDKLKISNSDIILYYSCFDHYYARVVYTMEDLYHKLSYILWKNGGIFRSIRKYLHR